jgi:hypothetical protein
MRKQNNKTELHAKMALSIKAAKKKLFKRHREGLQYGEAVDQFIEELTESLTVLMPDDGQEVELYGDAVDLKPEAERADREADTLLMFFGLTECSNAGIPDFITDAIIDALHEAGEAVGAPVPTFAPEESEAEQRTLLRNLFLQTKMLSLRDDDRKVLRAMYELLHNPQTPEELYQEVSEFVTNQSNQCDQNLYHSTTYLTEVLKSVKPGERIGVVFAPWAGGAK